MGTRVVGSIPKDDDRAAVLGTLSYIDGESVVANTGDPATGALLISVISDSSSGFFPKPYDEIALSNPEGNDNYQTITSLLSGVAQNVLTLTYDGNSNVTDIHKTT